MEERYGRLGRPISYVFLTSVLVFVVSAALGAVLAVVAGFIALMGQETPLWDILGGVTIVLLFLFFASSAFIVVCYGGAVVLTVGIDRLESRKNRVVHERLEAVRQEMLALPELSDEARNKLEEPILPEPDGGILRRFWLRLPRGKRKE